MKSAKFVITRFTNRNAAVSWRVEGRLHGIRIRKNFPTRAEAAAEKAKLELKSLQADSGMRSAGTFLADDQLREAEGLFRRLQGNAKSLTFCVDYALANYREPVAQYSLVNAVAEYLAKKAREEAQQIISVIELIPHSKAEFLTSIATLLAANYLLFLGEDRGIKFVREVETWPDSSRRRILYIGFGCLVLTCALLVATAVTWDKI